MAVTLEQFVRSLIRAGLFTSDELAAFQDSLPPDRRPQKPQDLARELIHAGRLTKYQAARVYQGKTKGLVLGDYVIQDEIGHGGMGEVFKAWRRDMERTVALKILPAKAMGSRDSVERFRREVKAAARLLHPNIVTAFDAGEAAGTHFLVMEHVDGKDLAHVLVERGPLPVDEAVDYTIQAAKGLQYAHEQGIVHRDIKPGNLLLDQRGTVKILDMGLARIDQPADPYASTAAEALTESGRVMGTYDYMAPEQAQDAHAADHRADVYSLGCTLYRLLTGQKPYQGDTPVKVLLAHHESPIPSLCEVRDDVPPELDGVVQKMLAKDPAERQQSMGALVTELEACIRPAPTAVPEPPTPPPVEQPASASSSSSDSALKAFLRNMAGRPAAAAPKVRPTTEETMAPHAEEATHTAVGKKAIFPAGQKSVILAVGGAAAVLVVLVGLVMILGGGGDETKEKPVAQPAPESDGRPTQGEEPTEPGAGPETPDWQTAWEETDAKAKTLIAEARFGEAEQLYSALGEGVDDLRLYAKVNEAVAAIQEQAKRAYEGIEAQAKQLSSEKKYAEARAVLDPVLNQHGVPANAEAAKQLLVEIDTAEEEAQAQAVAAQAEAARMARIEKQQQVEQRYAEAMKSVEELVAAWNFRGALTALENVRFEEEELAARATAWRAGAERLVDLKARIIAAINTADPPIRTTDLTIRGAGRDVVNADEAGLTAKLRSGQTEPLAWPDVGPQALGKLIELVSTPDNAADRLAAGVLALASKDPTSAETYFEQAESLGAEIGPYLAPLASASFTRAKELLDESQFTEADARIANLEAKYAAIPWFASNKQAAAAARDAAKTGVLRNEEAEKLYTEAARLFEKKELFDVRALVEQLKSDYADTEYLRRRGRRPSLLEMEKAVADLPKPIRVRLDGKGDHKSIQAAIDAAPSKSLIEIEDDGPYHEKLLIPKDKYELRVRGKKGCWPVVTSAGLPKGPLPLAQIEGVGAFIERLALMAGDLRVAAGDVRLRWAIVRGSIICTRGYQRKCECEDCFVTAARNINPGYRVEAPVVFRNCLFLGVAETGNELHLGVAGCEAQFCTILSGLGGAPRPPNGARDSILGAVVRSEVQLSFIENCVLLAGDVPEHAHACFMADPMFVDPENFDYRLKPGSPCIGKASDGGDIGCRYTPEMIELCQKALELRRAGILKF